MANPTSPVSTTTTGLLSGYGTVTTTARTLVYLANATESTKFTSSTSFTCHEVFIQSDPDNTQDIFLGDSTSQRIQLVSGKDISFRVDNLSQLYCSTSSGTATINFLVRY